MKPTIKEIIQFYNLDCNINWSERIQQCCFPDHDDGSPSLMYYPRTESFYCFGCLRGGDSYSFAAEYFKSIGEERSLGSIVRDFNDESYLENKELNQLEQSLNLLDQVSENIDQYYDRITNLVRSFLIETDSSQIKFADKIYIKLNQMYDSQNIDGLKKLLFQLPVFLSSKKSLFIEKQSNQSEKKEFETGLIDLNRYILSSLKKKKIQEYLKSKFIPEYTEISDNKCNIEKVNEIKNQITNLIKNNISYWQQVYNTEYDKKVLQIELSWGLDNSYDYEMITRLRSMSIPLANSQLKLIDKRYDYIKQHNLVDFDHIFPQQQLKVNFRFFKKI